MEKLTVKEAIDQGYTKYGFEDVDDQTVNDLHDDVFDDIDKDDWDGFVLCEKEPTTPIIDKGFILEVLNDKIIDANDEMLIDGYALSNSLESIDYTDILEKINKELSKFEYWFLTEIKLVK